MILRLIAFILLCAPRALAIDGYPADDIHNHDGSHPESKRNCGGNYMLPGETARLGSHSFMILGKEDSTHVIAEHRSGTPPHNYQFVFRVRLDPEEMKAYEEIKADSRTLPAFTTIWFDHDGKQAARTFWCLHDLEKIFGKDQKKGDEFESLFPIRASLQKNPDHEGSFEIEKSVARGKFLALERADFELLFHRYLPAYLAQDALRKAIREKGEALTKLFSHNPQFHDEPEARASGHASYLATDALLGTGITRCAPNYYLKGVPMPETLHGFLLLAELEGGKILATHLYDQAPQNFQTVITLKPGEEGLKLYRRAREGAGAPPLFLTKTKAGIGSFCMENIRELVNAGKFRLNGTVHKDPSLGDYRPGTALGELAVPAAGLEVLVNRRLESLMSLAGVVKSVQQGRETPGTKTNKSEY